MALIPRKRTFCARQKSCLEMCIRDSYYTALTVIRKLFSIGRAFLFDQLVLLIIKISGFSLSIRLPDSVSGFVIGLSLIHISLC